MSQPTANELQAVDPVLTRTMVTYMQDASRFVASRAFPGVPFDKDGETYYKFDKGYWLSDEAEERAYGDDYAESGFKASTGTAQTVQYALSKKIPDEDVANNQAPMDLRVASVNWLGLKFLIRKERLFAAAAMASSVWETDKTVDNKWSDTVNGDPVGDVTTGKRTISQSTGQKPNRLIMGEIVHDRLKLHPEIIERVKYVQRATGANVRAALADVFEVDELLVAEAIYNSANEGQTASISAIIDDDALLVYAEPTPSKFTPSAGYCFYWNPGGGEGAILRSVRIDKNDADMVKGKIQLVYTVVATDLGYFFPDVTD